MSAAAPATGIAAAVAAVRARIAAACDRAGRDPSGVTLIAASKTRPASDLLAAFAAGVTDFGENYVQEGVPKLAEVALRAEAPIGRHLIGHLQRNKAGPAVEAFDVLHGIDSARAIEAVARHATRPIGVFLQVNLAGEATKDGVAPDALGPLVACAREARYVDLLGLMAVPPAGTPESARPWFRQLRELAREHGLVHLSMGMTEDFEVAIEEGATHIRVGRALFGERTP